MFHPELPDTVAGMVDRILRVEAISGRALTEEEVKTLKAGEFLRKIAPYIFPPADANPSRPKFTC